MVAQRWFHSFIGLCLVLLPLKHRLLNVGTGLFLPLVQASMKAVHWQCSQAAILS